MNRQAYVRHLIFFVMITMQTQVLFSQNYPVFGPEIRVKITGLTFDAMEPFIAPDGNTLFFNSLNSGGNTNLYYASRTSDSSFNYMGLLGGTYDPSSDHLDGVASLDSLGNFFWVSLRGYPAAMENLHRGKYSGGTVSGVGRVYGDFNKYIINYPLGWLIMDAAISHQGDRLTYCNALFDFAGSTCAGLPCEARLGIAQKVNDSTFNRLPDTDSVFKNINNAAYLVYAPQLSRTGLTLYYTRLLKGTANTEICVSVRNAVSDVFSPPAVIHANSGFVPEAPVITKDEKILYYHQKDAAGIHRIFMRYRTLPSSISEPLASDAAVRLYPNPASGSLFVMPDQAQGDFDLEVLSAQGVTVFKTHNPVSIDLSEFDEGIYFFVIRGKHAVQTVKVLKN